MATICLHLPKQGSANKQTHHTELSSNDIAQLGDKQTNHTKLSSNDIVPIIFHPASSTGVCGLLLHLPSKVEKCKQNIQNSHQMLLEGLEYNEIYRASFQF